MRKIILSLATSLDGFIEGPNGEVDWMTFGEETGNALSAFLQEIDTILYGRISYEKWGTYIPPANASPYEKGFYAATGKMKKCVFSKSKAQLEGNPAIVHSNISEYVRNLKQMNGKDIWLYGGSSLVSSFINLNLIDELRIAVMPIILGSGKPLFSEIQNRVKLVLIKTNSSKSGVVELVYKNLK